VGDPWGRPTTRDDRGGPTVTISTTPEVRPFDGAIRPIPPGRRRWPWLVAAFALLVAGAIPAAFVVRRAAEPGGAISPEAAVESFLEAIRTGDLLGVLDVVEPFERATYRAAVGDLFSGLFDAGVLVVASNGGPEGVTIALAAEIRGVETVDDDLTVVTLDGALDVTIAAERLAGPVLVERRRLAGLGPSSPDPGFVVDLSDLRIATVGIDGRWYVSVLTSIAETWRARNGLPAPTTDGRVRPYGSADPAGVVDQIVRAVARADLERFVALLHPVEAEVLQRYAPLALDDLDRWIRGLEIGWALEAVDVEITVVGDRADVLVRGFLLEGLVGGSAARVSLSEGCLEITSDDRSDTWCAGAPAPEAPRPSPLDAVGQVREPTGANDGWRRAVAAVVGALSTDFDGFDLELRSYDGAWYLAPGTSAMRLLVGFTAGLGPAAAGPVLDAAAPLVDPLFGLGAASSGAAGVSACLGLPGDVELVLACIDAGIAAGRLSPGEVPVRYRHPECRLAGVGPEQFARLDDAAFAEIVEQANICFGLLALGGVIDPVEIPLEVRDPACYSESNPYRAGDVTAVDAALAGVTTCLLGSS
jgi:hypothetical protein